MECTDINCLEKLVGVRGTCTENVNCPEFYIDDLEGIDMASLADYATGLNLSGEAYARQLINTSARMMLGDLQALVSGGYSLIEALGELCSTCTFAPSFQVAGGVKVTRSILSQFAVIRITKIEVHTSVTGVQVLVLDDGKEKQKFTFTAMGALQTAVLSLDYTTSQNSVKISLEDTAAPLGLIVCERTAGCGCSGGSAPVNTPVVFTGLVAGMDASNGYGFKVCAALSCSNDVLMCSLMNQTPNLFGLTLLYRVGMQYFGNAPFSTRVNRTTLRNGEEISVTMQQYYESLYRERIAGSTKVKGLKQVTSDYLGRLRDKCIKCEALVKTSYAGG